MGDNGGNVTTTIISRVSGTRTTITEIRYPVTLTPSPLSSPDVVITRTRTETLSGDNAGVPGTSNTVAGGGGSTQNSGLPSASSSSLAASSVSSTVSSGAASVTGSPSATSASNGVSTGAVAGAAVGCLIAGALIAFLIAFLIFRKRSQRKPSSDGYSSSNDSQSRGEVIALTDKPSSKSAGAVSGWMAYLPQSADDRTIQNGVKTFFNLIELHVDNFYRKAPVELDQRTIEGLAQIDSGKLPGPIHQLMQDQRLVVPVIKHCIADLLITRMSPLAFPETSLLPANLSAVPTKLQSSSLASNERTAATQAYSQWRLLNAYLYPHPEEDPVYVDDREAKANDISELLRNAFGPWQGLEEDKGEMHQHEKGLVATAGNLGILLMSQPSAFEFKWSAGSDRSSSGRSLIALPGFWKSTDEQGRPLGQPGLLVSPVIMRV